MGLGPNTSLSIFAVAGHELRRNWGWLLTLGILLIILGIIALVDTISVTVVSMFFFGWVLLVAGVVEAVQAYRHRRTGHLFLHVLNAVLSVIVGLMLIRHPLPSALAITLLLAAYFTVAGIFRIVAALSMRTQRWGWALADGIITLILGILVWTSWPASGLWIIGLFIGIDLIVTGWSEVMLSLAARSLPLEAA